MVVRMLFMIILVLNVSLTTALKSHFQVIHTDNSSDSTLPPGLSKYHVTNGTTTLDFGASSNYSDSFRFDTPPKESKRQFRPKYPGTRLQGFGKPKLHSYLKPPSTDIIEKNFTSIFSNHSNGAHRYKGSSIMPMHIIRLPKLSHSPKLKPPERYKNATRLERAWFPYVFNKKRKVPKNTGKGKGKTPDKTKTKQKEKDKKPPKQISSYTSYKKPKLKGSTNEMKKQTPKKMPSYMPYMKPDMVKYTKPTKEDMKKEKQKFTKMKDDYEQRKKGEPK